MAHRTLFHSLTRLAPHGSSRSWVLAEGERILTIGEGQSWKDELGAQLDQAEVRDAEGWLLTPGFTDIHCHGGGGTAFEDAPDVAAALRVHGQAGTSALVASLVSNPLEQMQATMKALLPLMGQQVPRQATLHGFHAEGPFISPAHKGAHASETLQVPTPDALEQLWEASEGRLLQITLAPETDPGLATLRRCVELGIRVAVGHTDTTYEQAKAAFDEGASLLTHTYNAMRPLHHRQPGPIAAAADSPHVTLELICDGVHVHGPMVRAAFSLAPGRVALVTDAMAAAGCADGPYQLGSLAVEVQDSVARIKGTETIAGSTLTLARAVKQAVAFDVPLIEAAQAATSVPATALGLAEPADSYALLGADGSLQGVLRG
ncbi:MAG: amidohydrolase family protein [Rothia sp. (in: high G+C Gram-positive bacteria)]|uniref:N-acetylglucosamine-6-phosphate deacetylase n=1 Tax=Rothia sp. (in: high G+C Gram-positive bacteria) TaxID=1885016 RepID=UPI0026F6F704|nr:amidohydrolase family protein [Rothia sp. (in: high G+C Gram-positive bacteria)]